MVRMGQQKLILQKLRAQERNQLRYQCVWIIGNEKFLVKFEYQYLLMFEKMAKSKFIMVYFL